ncbi:MAG: hypothetical protein LBD80_05370 [Tannerella sp.]|jgi:hypothetical protein|nr:hypothetical protein [Tannerella sp.]
MNNTFNIKRFGLVLRKDMLENWKQYTYLFLMMFGIIAIVLLWSSWNWNYYINIKAYAVNSDDLNLELLLLSSLMFAIFGILFASTLMNPMNDKTKRIAHLTCPASDFEKSFSRWVIVTAGYIVSFFASLWIVDALRVGICTAAGYPGMEVNFLDLSKLIYTGDASGANRYDSRHYFFDSTYTFAVVLSLYFLVQSIFILGSTFWEKAAFVKTFCMATVICLVFIFTCRWAILLSYNNFGAFQNVLESIFLAAISENKISRELAFAVMVSVILVFTLTNWTLTFCRFHEAEIIKRL